MIISDLQYIKSAAEIEVRGGTGELVPEPEVPGDDYYSNDKEGDTDYRRPRRGCPAPGDPKD